jgi:hypothetical protein
LHHCRVGCLRFRCNKFLLGLRFAYWDATRECEDCTPTWESLCKDLNPVVNSFISVGGWVGGEEGQNKGTTISDCKGFFRFRGSCSNSDIPGGLLANRPTRTQFRDGDLDKERILWKNKLVHKRRQAVGTIMSCVPFGPV